MIRFANECPKKNVTFLAQSGLMSTFRSSTRPYSAMTVSVPIAAVMRPSIATTAAAST